MSKEYIPLTCTQLFKAKTVTSIVGLRADDSGSHTGSPQGNHSRGCRGNAPVLCVKGTTETKAGTTPDPHCNHTHRRRHQELELERTEIKNSILPSIQWTHKKAERKSGNNRKGRTKTSSRAGDQWRGSPLAGEALGPTLSTT